jgi:hypothetical protein
MPQKIKILALTFGILLLAALMISAAGGWYGPLAQMDMPTDTVQPQMTPQDTPTPMESSPGNVLPSPTWTSIFTGYTPYPDATYAYGGMSGMSGTQTMNGTPMSGMGGMGGMSSMSGSMDMSGCPMMSGMSMSGGTTMGGTTMQGMNMSGGYMIEGMDMDDMYASVEDDPTTILSNPWVLIGWVLLGLLFLGILAAIIVGIARLILRSRRPTVT